MMVSFNKCSASYFNVEVGDIKRNKGGKCKIAAYCSFFIARFAYKSK